MQQISASLCYKTSLENQLRVRLPKRPFSFSTSPRLSLPLLWTQQACSDSTIAIQLLFLLALRSMTLWTPTSTKWGSCLVKKNKKGGIDNVNADLAQLVPDEFTRLYHPLHLKMALCADEPLALKGGVACVLQNKNKQHILTAHKFRSIMLRNYVVKHDHAFLRTRLYALVHCSFHAAQSGGIKGRGTDLANATLRWNQHAYKGHNQSCVIFFTDVEAAFYSTIRELLLPSSSKP